MKNYETDGRNGGNLLVAVLCGAAVGAAVGLLLAPKAGAELRQQLHESAARLRRRAADGYTAAVETATNAVDEVIDRGSKAVQRGQETYENVRKTAKDVAERVTQSAS